LVLGFENLRKRQPSQSQSADLQKRSPGQPVAQPNRLTFNREHREYLALSHHPDRDACFSITILLSCRKEHQDDLTNSLTQKIQKNDSPQRRGDRRENKQKNNMNDEYLISKKTLVNEIMTHCHFTTS
jgi:hypothetical protein